MKDKETKECKVCSGRGHLDSPKGLVSCMVCQRISNKLPNKEEEMIPCDCPKGGMYDDGRICKKCDGSQWVSPSDKTWDKEEERWRFRIRCVEVPTESEILIYGYGKMLDKIEKIVEEELTLATIKAKEDLLEKLRYSWDISEEGWCVQIWYGNTILDSLTQKSDEIGMVKLSVLNLEEPSK